MHSLDRSAPPRCGVLRCGAIVALGTGWLKADDAILAGGPQSVRPCGSGLPARFGGQRSVDHRIAVGRGCLCNDVQQDQPRPTSRVASSFEAGCSASKRHCYWRTANSPCHCLGFVWWRVVSGTNAVNVREIIRVVETLAFPNAPVLPKGVVPVRGGNDTGAAITGQCHDIERSVRAVSPSSQATDSMPHEFRKLPGTGRACIESPPVTQCLGTKTHSNRRASKPFL